MNTAMRFSLAHNWQVVCAGLLIIAAGLLVSCKQPAPKAVYQPPVIAHVAPPSQPDNPFAVPSYCQTEAEQPVSTFSFHPKPILEPNRISPEENPAVCEATPYFSPRYAAETQAIETNAGSPSQSGHYILIRPAPETPDEAPKAPAIQPKPIIAKTAVPAVSGDLPLKPASPLRIRSTMGRHDSVNGKISPPRS